MHVSLGGVLILGGNILVKTGEGRQLLLLVLVQDIEHVLEELQLLVVLVLSLINPHDLAQKAQKDVIVGLLLHEDGVHGLEQVRLVGMLTSHVVLSLLLQQVSNEHASGVFHQSKQVLVSRVDLLLVVGVAPKQQLKDGDLVAQLELRLHLGLDQLENESLLKDSHTLGVLLALWVILKDELQQFVSVEVRQLQEVV